MLFVPGNDDVLIVPSTCCDRCTKEKTGYICMWKNITQDEIDYLVRWGVRGVRIRCVCK